jgi:uncharacterized membrane protein YbaN (DUF454 family)
MRRYPFTVLAYLCVGLAGVGLVVPVLPTVPFLLVAAWAGARGSSRLHTWIIEHPQFGPLLRDWREQGAVPARAKLLTVVTLLTSWSLLAWHLEGNWIAQGAGVLFALIALFVVSRPAPRSGASRTDR